jgi:hypothetical protein
MDHWSYVQTMEFERGRSIFGTGYTIILARSMLILRGGLPSNANIYPDDMRDNHCGISKGRLHLILFF